MYLVKTKFQLVKSLTLAKALWSHLCLQKIIFRLNQGGPNRGPRATYGIFSGPLNNFLWPAEQYNTIQVLSIAGFYKKAWQAYGTESRVAIGETGASCKMG